MSFFKGRKSSQITLDKKTSELVIIDDAPYFRLMQVFLSVFGTAPLFIILLKDFEFSLPASFLISLVTGLYAVIMILVIYYYLFKSSAAYRIKKDHVEELLIINMLLSSDSRLSIKLKNGKYRNLIVNDNMDLEAVIKIVEDLNIKVTRRTKYQLLPLNY